MLSIDAANATEDSGSSPTQFIGSKISLLSKSEIRYEGILYALDLRAATISLAGVRSFGTEDRPTNRPIPGRDEIYEFIIFRGSDIKTIDVVEPPRRDVPNSDDPTADEIESDIEKWLD